MQWKTFAFAESFEKNVFQQKIENGTKKKKTSKQRKRSRSLHEEVKKFKDDFDYFGNDVDTFFSLIEDGKKLKYSK